MSISVRELYGEETVDAALNRLETRPTTEDMDGLLKQIGINPRILKRTVQKGMEEYVDGLVELRHGWKPKMMDGNPEEKKGLYGDLHGTIKRMDEFSEPYVSAMRLIADAALTQLEEVTSPDAESREHVKEASHYTGARHNFDEQNIAVTQIGTRTPATERKKPASMPDAYSQIATGFMRLKDLSNLLEDATTPEVYQNVRNTNEFPEARIGQCFEVAHEIDKAMSQVMEGYKFLSKKSLREEDKRKVEKTLKFLKGLDRGRITRSTQWYAALQFHEAPWNIAYYASLAATMAGVIGSAYSLAKEPPAGLAFLSSAAWSVISGVGIYSFTDAGPKTAKFLRKLDEKVVRYRWV